MKNICSELAARQCNVAGLFFMTNVSDGSSKKIGNESVLDNSESSDSGDGFVGAVSSSRGPSVTKKKIL